MNPPTPESVEAALMRARACQTFHHDDHSQIAGEDRCTLAAAYRQQSEEIAGLREEVERERADADAAIGRLHAAESALEAVKAWAVKSFHILNKFSDSVESRYPEHLRCQIQREAVNDWRLHRYEQQELMFGPALSAEPEGKEKK